MESLRDQRFVVIEYASAGSVDHCAELIDRDLRDDPFFSHTLKQNPKRTSVVFVNAVSVSWVRAFVKR